MCRSCWASDNFIHLMKILLTGITGNLGHELADWLIQNNVEIIPCVRHGRAEELRDRFPKVVETDLITEKIHLSEKIDCIVHCAGVVHFQKAGQQNESMMGKVVDLARQLDIPVYHISTAFVYRPQGEAEFNNSYESDKHNAESVLMQSGIPNAIFRPSVLVGNSKTGAIRNFSGYYYIVEAFLGAIKVAYENKRLVRFPKMLGESNIVPVDIAAATIGRGIIDGLRGVIYVTNPNPPSSMWVLKETLDFFNVQDNIELLDMTFEEFGKLDLTIEEGYLYKFSKHFNPYWSMRYSFPKTACSDVLINHEYMSNILRYFQNSKNTHA